MKLKLSYKTLSIIILLLCMILLIPQAYAQPDEQLIVTYQDIDDATKIKIENISNFLNKTGNLRSATNKYDELLKTLAFTEEEIASMSNEYKASYSNAISADVITSTFEIEKPDAPTTNNLNKIVEETNHIHKLTITTRVVRQTDYVTNTQTYSTFRINTSVVFDRLSTYNPQIRLKDLLSFHWTTNALILGDKSGYFICDVQDFFSKKYKSTSYSYMGSNIVKEYPSGADWGIMYDLPANSLINGYYNFRLGGEVTIGVTENFNLYSAYAHKRLAGNISVSTSGAGLSFSGTGIDVSPTPVLTVII